MLEMFAAMLRILATWAVVLAAFTGIGLGFRRLWGLRGLVADDVLGGFWTGLVIVVGMLSLWHLVWPVRWPVQAVVAAMGGAGLGLAGRDLWAWGRATVRRRGMVAVAAVVAVLMANRALGPCTTFDSGLYHLNAVRWTTEYPIVPGLGNLHGPLAYNNAGLQIAALLEVGPWHGQSSHLANPLYLLVLLFHILLAASQLVRAKADSPMVRVYWLFLLTPVILMMNRSWASSHNIEVLVAVVTMVAGGRMLAFLASPSPPDRRQDFDVLVIVLLLVLAVCVKLSSLVLAATAGVAVLWVYGVRCRRIGRGLSALRRIVGLPMVIFLVWLGRGVVLSGHILYPLPMGSLPVEWAMPDHLEGEVRQAIVGEALGSIQPGAVLDWVGHLGREILMPTVIALAALAVVARCRPRPAGGIRGPWLLVIAVLPAIAAWAVAAPQKRFAFFLFWILAGAIGAMALAGVNALASRRRRIVVTIVMMVVGVANITPSKVFYGRGPDGGLHPTPSATMTTYVTAGNLTLYVPVNDTQCWDSLLPSTPDPRPDLRLRRPGDLASGFVIDPSLASPATQPASSRQVTSPD